MPTTRAASTPSRRAMRKAESKKQSFSVLCRHHASLPSISVKGKPAPKMGPRKGHPLVATHSQLEILVYTARPPRVKFTSSYPAASPDGRICIYMILAMIQPRCHLAIRSQTARWVMFARRFAAATFAGMLMVAPVFPQSSAGPSSPVAAPAQAAPPSTPRPQPDKGRAKKAFQEGRRAEQSGDWKAEFAAYTEAATYDPSNREYAMLKEHARFQVVQSLVDSAERQAIAGTIPGARALLTQGLEIDPNYVVARERFAELTPIPAVTEPEKAPRLAGLPRLILKPGAEAFDYRGTTRGAYE